MGESWCGGGAVIPIVVIWYKPITLGSNVHQTQPGEVGVWGLQCSKQQSKGVVADVVRVESREYGWQLTKSVGVFVSYLYTTINHRYRYTNNKEFVWEECNLI